MKNITLVILLLGSLSIFGIVVAQSCSNDPFGYGTGCIANTIGLGGTNYCGDGIKRSTESCDDGNTTNGDGCDSNCHLEANALMIQDIHICNAIFQSKLITIFGNVYYSIQLSRNGIINSSYTGFSQSGGNISIPLGAIAQQDTLHYSLVDSKLLSRSGSFSLSSLMLGCPMPDSNNDDSLTKSPQAIVKKMNTQRRLAEKGDSLILGNTITMPIVLPKTGFSDYSQPNI